MKTAASSQTRSYLVNNYPRPSSLRSFASKVETSESNYQPTAYRPRPIATNVAKTPTLTRNLPQTNFNCQNVPYVPVNDFQSLLIFVVYCFVNFVNIIFIFIFYFPRVFTLI